MECMRQKIADYLKETIGQYYSFRQEEMEDVTDFNTEYILLLVH